MKHKTQPEICYELMNYSHQKIEDGGYIVKMVCNNCEKDVSNDENKIIKNFNGRIVYICGDCSETYEEDDIPELVITDPDNL